MSDVSRSSEDSSDEEEILYNLLNFELRKIPKNEGYIENTVPLYNDKEFMEHFRISKDLVDQISERFLTSNFFKLNSYGPNDKITAKAHILIFLWFAGHQTSSFRDVADRFDISISSLYRIIRRVTNFLSNMSGEVIRWPTNEEKNNIEQYFRESGFPGVVGIIDGSHIKIDKPKEDPDSYINRKKFFSIQVQAVCDHQLRVRDLFLGFPGSVHDSRVFRSSSLFRTLPEKCGDYHYILGDAGYPCLKNLLTPFRDRGNLTRVEKNFNKVHAKNRYLIEHCFGRVKQKFRQLYHLKIRNIEQICHFIRACFVLHNLSLNDNFQYDEELIQQEVNDFRLNNDNGGDNNDNNNDRNGLIVRNDVAIRIYRH